MIQDIAPKKYDNHYEQENIHHSFDGHHRNRASRSPCERFEHFIQKRWMDITLMQKEKNSHIIWDAME